MEREEENEKKMVAIFYGPRKNKADNSQTPTYRMKREGDALLGVRHRRRPDGYQPFDVPHAHRPVAAERRCLAQGRIDSHPPHARAIVRRGLLTLRGNGPRRPPDRGSWRKFVITFVDGA